MIFPLRLYNSLFVKCVQLNNFDLQFHPESVATCYGSQIFKNFREITDEYWLRFRSSFKEKRAYSDGKLKNIVTKIYSLCCECTKDVSLLQTLLLLLVFPSFQ